MNTRIHLIALALLSASLTTDGFAQHDANPFIGRWTLYLPDGAGWLEVQEDHGFLDASLLWYGGSVLPVASVNVSGDVLTVTRTASVERQGGRTHTLTSSFQFRRNDDDLDGVASFPNRDGMGHRMIEFRGQRLPDTLPAPDVSAREYGEPVDLFNGVDLTGWSLVNADRENGFMAKDGMLINNPVQPDGDDPIAYGNLRTDATFEDFRLTLEVNVPEGSNSGVYLRGLYEIQVADTYGRELDSHHMGGLYSRVTPTASAERKAGQWQSMDITLHRRHVTVILNGTKIIDNQPVLGVTGGALTADEFSPGPIYVQGDHGRVLYRNLVLTPILN